jgi:hypothetical protein
MSVSHPNQFNSHKLIYCLTMSSFYRLLCTLLCTSDSVQVIGEQMPCIRLGTGRYWGAHHSKARTPEYVEIRSGPQYSPGAV